MKRFGALLSVAALFASGLAIGALSMHLYYVSQLRDDGGPPAVAAQWFSRHLERELELTPDQARELEAILARTRAEAETLRRDLGPRVHALLEASSEEIEELLTPEQRERFTELRRRQRRRAEHFLLGPPGGPGGPGGPHHGPRGRHRPGRP